MRSNWVDLRALKALVNLEAVLRHYGVEGLRRSGRSDHLRGPCPLHGRGGGDAFHASLSKNAFRCFYCRAQGNVLDFVAAMEQCSVWEAALRLQHWFAEGADVALPRPDETQLVPEKEACNPPLRFTLWGVDHRHPYLTQRGIESSTADYFGVGFYARPGLMSQRLVIPIHDEKGRLIAYAGRSLDGARPRYLLPPGFHSSLALFNLHRAQASASGRTVVVVEGFFDCMKVHQSGFPGVIALMGANLSMSRENLLLQRFEQIVLLLDGDPAGRAASHAIASRLNAKCHLQVHELPWNQQPDQLTSEQIRTVLANPGRAW
jgi:DNA primase